MNEQKHLIVFGGTSGIGLALARHYLSLGWRVSIIGHSADKISRLQYEFNSNKFHSNFSLFQCDIRDNDALVATFKKLATLPFDCLIYSIGWYLPERRLDLSHAENAKMLALNLHAFQRVFQWASEQIIRQTSVEKSRILNSAESVTNKSTTNESVEEKPSVQLVSIASVAGILDYPDASVYAQCKRAMIATCDAYRPALAPFHTSVTCIASGYVATEQLLRIHGGHIKKPFVVSEVDAVAEITDAINNKVATCIFPKPTRFFITLLRLVPRKWLNRLMTR